MTATAGILEKLREEVKEALDVKERGYQRVLDLKKTLSEAMGELQQIDDAIRTASGMPRQRILDDSPQAISQPQVMSQTEVRYQTMDSLYGIPTNQPENPMQKDSVFHALIKEWVIPLAVLVVVLWVLINGLQYVTQMQNNAPDTSGASTTSFVLPSLIATAEACPISDRMRDRVQERRDLWESGLEESDNEVKNIFEYIFLRMSIIKIGRYGWFG